MSPITEAGLVTKVMNYACNGANFKMELTGASANNNVITGRRSEVTILDPADLVSWSHPNYSELVSSTKEYRAPEAAHLNNIWHMSGPTVLARSLGSPLVESSIGDAVFHQDIGPARSNFRLKMISSGGGTFFKAVYFLRAGVDYHANVYGSGLKARMSTSVTESAAEAPGVMFRMGYYQNGYAKDKYATSSKHGIRYYDVSSIGDEIAFAFPEQEGYRAPDLMMYTAYGSCKPTATDPDWDPYTKVHLSFHRLQDTFSKSPRLPLTFSRWENLQDECDILRWSSLGYEGVTTAIKRDTTRGTFPPSIATSVDGMVLAVHAAWYDNETPYAFSMTDRDIERCANEMGEHSSAALMQRYGASFWKKLGRGLLTGLKHVTGPVLSLFPQTKAFAPAAHSAMNRLATRYGASAGYGRRMQAPPPPDEEDEDLTEPQTFTATSWALGKRPCR